MNNIECFFYINPDYIEIGIYNTETQKIVFHKKIHLNINFFENQNINKSNNNVLKDLIIEIEKNIKKSINKVNLIIDSPFTFTISASIKKNFDNSKISKEQIEFLIKDLKQLISKSNKLFRINHIIIDNFLINGKNLTHAPINEICDELILNSKFICIQNNLLFSLESYFKSHQIEFSTILCAKYLHSFMQDGFKSIFQAAVALKDGHNQNEVFISSKKPIKLGFFEKLFHFFS